MSLVRGGAERVVVEWQEAGGCVDPPLTVTTHHTISQISEEEQEQV
jgi:hypothetical protein